MTQKQIGWAIAGVAFAVFLAFVGRETSVEGSRPAEAPVAAPTEAPRNDGAKLLADADAKAKRDKELQQAWFIIGAQGYMCDEALEVAAMGKKDVSDVVCAVAKDGKQYRVTYNLDIPGDRITIKESREVLKK